MQARSQGLSSNRPPRSPQLASSLSWKFHIEHIVVKISRLVGIIVKFRHYVPRNTLLRIYQSLILPYISYGLTAWGLASKSYLTKILVLQKRALRFIFCVERCKHAVPLFIHADIFPLDFLYFKSVCCLMHDIRNRKVPSSILNLFSDTTSIHFGLRQQINSILRNLG